MTSWVRSHYFNIFSDCLSGPRFLGFVSGKKDLTPRLVYDVWHAAEAEYEPAIIKIFTIPWLNPYRKKELRSSSLSVRVKAARSFHSFGGSATLHNRILDPTVVHVSSLPRRGGLVKHLAGKGGGGRAGGAISPLICHSRAATDIPVISRIYALAEEVTSFAPVNPKCRSVDQQAEMRCSLMITSP